MYNSTSNPPPEWNNTDSPESNQYGTPGGKPGLQAFFQNQINIAAGKINTAEGWNTFLNYYYWLQQSVDTLIGKVLADIAAKFPAGQPTQPIVIFTSDHGDFGGSHNLHAKGGALYDEAYNVPLLIHMRNQNYNASRTFACSSVDILPFIYTAALGNESWRGNSNDIVSYLNGRESIFDFIFANAADSRRLAPYTNYGGFGATGGRLPYVLFSTDEYFAAGNYFSATGPDVPSHAIGFRTVDNSVVYQDANVVGGNLYGGGKLGMYTSWLNCTTYPDTTASGSLAPQFEFYDYYTNNYGEIGNDAFDSAGMWNAATAGVYLNSYNNIMANELYRIDPKFSNGFNTAFNLYQGYLYNASVNGSSNSCGMETFPPGYIPPP